MNINRKAFLDMLAYSEGTDHPKQDSLHDGYDVVVGGGLFQDFSRHPERRIFLPKVRNALTGKLGIYSTAAGRYQFIRATWLALQKKLKLPDFSPASQDAACIELLKECGALPFIDQGQFAKAVFAARKIWASLPGAGYLQREQSIARLRTIYVAKGGRLA